MYIMYSVYFQLGNLRFANYSFLLYYLLYLFITFYQELVSEVTKKWNDMSHVEKNKYIVQAATLMEQYKEDIDKWEKEMISLGHPDIVRRKNRKQES